MYSWLREVRQVIRELVTELFDKLNNIRISLIAHGDYYDARHCTDSYVLQYEDFTTDIDKLTKFTNVKSTYGGGDGGECYEYVMWTAAHRLSWTRHGYTKRVLVIIGDDQPHTPDFRDNIDKVDWKQELNFLKQMNIHCYGVYCGGSDQYWHNDKYAKFYKRISQETGGKYLELGQAKNLSHLIMALCLSNSSNPELLREYRGKDLIIREG